MKITMKQVLPIILLIFVTGCSMQTAPEQPEYVNGVPTENTQSDTPTPFQPLPTATYVPKFMSDLVIYVQPTVPEGILAGLPEDLTYTDQENQADLSLTLFDANSISAEWVYAVVGPFPMVQDEMSFEELQDQWNGTNASGNFILVTDSTFQAMQTLLGEPKLDVVEIVDQSQLIDRLWALQDAIAIVPFEDLEPRLKVLSVDGQSPTSNQFEVSQYPLKVTFGWGGNPTCNEILQKAMDQGEFPSLVPNRDPGKLTVMVMTGVTALVRATAARMEQMGMTYPGKDIRDWLVNADLTHISNEVSFTPTCPNPNPNQAELIFCSKPEYIELLDDVGTDILDLTGNHGIDWGREALVYSLDLYKQRGWAVFAAGMNVEEARAAVTIEHNGNRFAFIGCNPAGPPFIWAGENLSGVANCDYPWMWAEISRLRDQGYIVITTFQYFETYRAYVESYEETDFRAMADAGATIVSGSQAHHPMAMEFYGNSYIHYGLGNLFFDQMFNETYTIPQGTRKEFIDRHVFYDGKFISTELLTAFLEDFSRPRPMTIEERQTFLSEIFDAGGWSPGSVWSYELK